MDEIPDGAFPSFKDDDDLFLLPEPPTDAEPSLPEPPADNDPGSEVLTRASEVQPLPLSDMEIMRWGRVILQRRALPYSFSTSIGGASPANTPPDLLNEGVLVSDPPPWLALLAPGLEVSQAARQARATNDRLSQDAPSASRRRAQLHSDDSDSDDQPLAQRRRRRAPRPVSDSDPSSIPSPPPPVAAASLPPPIVTPPPVPSQADVSPNPTAIPVEPPTAQPSPPAQLPTQPSTSPQH
ncbi:proline-rich receptor-like protein kinase PERK10 [Zingiber officinale]|uniref:proline-rich receptor-like protein kinase PERK10 n=1 Tax=Zingiber officinale TaxID=94328 RepID=UPI001C4BF8AC|nr:proline-rich receptor-like protein kinase PERK10 [Zingiber officinale]